MSRDVNNQAVDCPGCRKAMRFVRAMPGIGGLPDLWTFDCRGCAMVITGAKSMAAKSATITAGAPEGRAVAA